MSLCFPFLQYELTHGVESIEAKIKKELTFVDWDCIVVDQTGFDLIQPLLTFSPLPLHQDPFNVYRGTLGPDRVSVIQIDNPAWANPDEVLWLFEDMDELKHYHPELFESPYRQRVDCLPPAFPIPNRLGLTSIPADSPKDFQLGFRIKEKIGKGVTNAHAIKAIDIEDTPSNLSVIDRPTDG